jgi:hypothetical protein
MQSIIRPRRSIGPQPYRFHPVNLWLGSFLVTAVMLYLGISAKVVLFLVAFDTTTAVFVHANLNWTLGPLKYVVATPVFHRWHHTRPDEGGNANFGSLFSLWDVLFGTFHMPERELIMGSTSLVTRSASLGSSSSHSGIGSRARSGMKLLLHPARQRLDLPHGRRDLDVEERASALGGRLHRIARRAVRLEREWRIGEPREIDARRMRRHQFRSACDAGREPDRRRRLAPDP